MRLSIIFFLSVLSSSMFADSQTGKASNEAIANTASADLQLKPGATLYVTKRFMVGRSDGLHDFSVGKKVTLVRHDQDGYIVTDGAVQGRAPKESFTQNCITADIKNANVDKPKGSLTQNTNNYNNSQIGIGTNTIISSAPSDLDSSPARNAQRSLGDVIRQIFKGDNDDVFMTSYFSDETLISIGIVIFIIFGLIIFVVGLIIFLYVSHRGRISNETSDEREFRIRAEQVKGSKIGIAISICGAMFFLLFYDTTVQTERRPAKYYDGIQIMPAIPSMQVHNLERANFQRNMIMVFFGLAIINAIRLVSISQK